MNYRILVTGVGAVIGYGAIEALRASKYDVTIIGADIYSDAVGASFCDEFVVNTRAADPDFPARFSEILSDNRIDLVLPGIEQDVQAIAKHHDIIAKSSSKLALNDLELIDTFFDKWKTHLYFVDHGVPTIKTFIEGSYDYLKKELGSPFLLKPRRSQAAKGIVKIETEEDLHYWKNKLGDNFMTQRIAGDIESEYTVGLFGLGDGSYADKIVMRRKLGPDGATSKAWVVDDIAVDEFVSNLCKASKPIGPTNVQIMKEKDRCLLLEVNPRLSSSTSIRQAFGYNDPEMCIEYYLLGQRPSARTMRQKGFAARYYKNHVKYDSDSS